MDPERELEFATRDRKDIYEYVEREGRIDYETARRALQMDERAFGHHVTILQRDGVLERDGDDLLVAFESGDVEEFDDGGVRYAIRQARQEDLTGLVGVMRQAVSKNRYIEAETVADIVDHERVLLRHNDLESRMFFVATVDDDVVGWVNVSHPELEKLAHTAELTVGVLEEYRGHGIGGRLLQRGVDWAAEHGYERLYNSVPSTNGDAVDFLESRGWETEAVREDHYKIDDEYVDEVMLALDLRD
ncbi:MAG: N-acetyltransferase family protein [Halobacteriaceae archaeon]